MIVPFSISDFIDRAVGVYGERIGVIDEPDQPAPSMGELTYAEIGALARRQAAKLDELGIGVGDRVAVVSHNSARLLTSFFGVAGTGRVLVPVNFRLRPDEVAYIIEHSGARMLLVDPELDDALADIKTEFRFVLGDDENLFAPEGTEPKHWEPDENATACINYTSGTTARPKGVQITHRNIWVNAVTFGVHAGVSDRDVYLHTLPMFHANGWGMPFTMTGLGVPQVVIRKIDGAEILRRVETYRVTVMCAAPAVVAAVLEAAQHWEGEIPGRGRTRIIVAGAPPPTKTVARVEEELGWEFIQIYGLTETSPLLTSQPHSFGVGRAVGARTGREAGACRRAGARRAALRRRGGRGAGAGPTWCSRATGSSRRSPRRRSTEGGSTRATAARSATTATSAISDRKKDVIITGGENVSSIEVEDVLFSHPAVEEVAVIGVPDEKWGETIKALVVLAEGESATEEDLVRWCKDKAAGFKAPTSVEFRDELARTATGKLQKFKLRKPYWEGRERQVN